MFARIRSDAMWPYVENVITYFIGAVKQFMTTMQRAVDEFRKALERPVRCVDDMVADIDDSQGLRLHTMRDLNDVSFHAP